MSAIVLPLRVAAVDDIAPTLRHLTLVHAHGAPLPAASAGAHVQLRLPLQGGGRTLTNAYSLINAPGRRGAYEVIVRRVDASRGGSAFVHEGLTVGAALEASAPFNLFAPDRTARRHLMLAGGIGVTPFLSYIREFEQWAMPYELRLCSREAEARVFDRWLPASAAIARHWRAPGAALDLPALLAAQPAGTALYVCGPAPMIEQVCSTAAALGWPAGQVHAESFGAAAAPGRRFTAELRASGARVEVGEHESLLEALERAGLKPASLCRGGACGMCELAVLDGEPEHRDHCLSDEQRRAGRCIMPCVSRASTPVLVLDL